jgi:hypothetical protein
MSYYSHHNSSQYQYQPPQRRCEWRLEPCQKPAKELESYYPVGSVERLWLCPHRESSKYPLVATSYEVLIHTNRCGNQRWVARLLVAE